MWLSGKESTCSAEATGDAGSIPGLGRSSGVGNGNPLQRSCLKIPWVRKELDMTEHAHRDLIHVSGVIQSLSFGQFLSLSVLNMDSH